ncbi:hypothetical protein PVAG01_06823 [Phlyctema vagabunda]|uniref:Uncharacterized protein n=1 Tax=Phlyctema vagabunda TaxID=108571 RepID=A0ABR4PH54_9HELO
MRFSTLLTTGALAAVALAAPQEAGQTQQAIDALQSYIQGIQTDSAFLSIVTEVADNTAGLATLTSFQASLESQVVANETPAADWLEALPTQWQSFFGSVYTAEVSLLSAAGFTSSVALATPSRTGAAATTTGTSSASSTAATTESANAAPTMGSSGMIAGMLAVGLGGAMIAL